MPVAWREQEFQIPRLSPRLITWGDVNSMKQIPVTVYTGIRLVLDAPDIVRAAVSEWVH